MNKANNPCDPVTRLVGKEVLEAKPMSVVDTIVDIITKLTDTSNILADSKMLIDGTLPEQLDYCPPENLRHALTVIDGLADRVLKGASDNKYGLK